MMNEVTPVQSTKKAYFYTLSLY